MTQIPALFIVNFLSHKVVKAKKGTSALGLPVREIQERINKHFTFLSKKIIFSRKY